MKNLVKMFVSGLVFVVGTCPQTFASTAIPCGANESNCWPCGENNKCIARLDDKGNFTISGTGAMTEYTSFKKDGYWQTRAPWNSVMNQIKHVKVEDGITSVGGRSFISAYNIESIDLGSVETIGWAAFFIDSGKKNLSKLQNLTIPASVTEIKGEAFENNRALQNVNFANGSQLETVGVSAFYDTGIRDIVLPDNDNLVLDDQVFAYTPLRSIVIPEGAMFISSFRNLSGTLSVYCTQATIDSGKCSSSYLGKSPLEVTHYEYDGDHFNVYDSNGKIVAQYGNFADFGTTNYYVPQAPKEVRRIYTVQEAEEAAKGNKNTFSIRYR